MLLAPLADLFAAVFELLPTAFFAFGLQIFIFIVKIIFALIDCISGVTVYTHDIGNKFIYIFFELIKSIDLISLGLRRRLYGINHIVNVTNAVVYCKHFCFKRFQIRLIFSYRFFSVVYQTWHLIDLACV